MRQGKEEEFSLLPKRLCARQIAFPYSFARINKWRLGTSLSLLCIDVVKRNFMLATLGTWRVNWQSLLDFLLCSLKKTRNKHKSVLLFKTIHRCNRNSGRASCYLLKAHVYEVLCPPLVQDIFDIKYPHVYHISNVHAVLWGATL